MKTVKNQAKEKIPLACDAWTISIISYLKAPLTPPQKSWGWGVFEQYYDINYQACFKHLSTL